MSAPDITDAEVAAVNQVLASNTLSIGPRLVEFEEKLASYVGVNYAIGVSSGTAGLHLCMIAEGVGENDLVITPSFSFIASANSILYERAAPIFVDVDPTTGNIDPHQAAEAVHDLMKGGRFAERWLPRTLHGNSEAYRLKALLPVHAFGQPADMDSLLDIARHYHLSVIEDACEAIGSQYKGRIVGTLGDSAVFAFYPNKQMTTGEGGMIVTNSNGKANLIRSLRNQGRDVFDAWLNHTRLGYNYRMDEMSAALGAVQIARIDELLAKRAEVAQWYHERLKNIEWIDRPIVTPETTRMSWFVYVIKIKPPFNRDEVMNDLAEVGIPCRPYFTPIHLQPFYREKFGYRRGDLPNTEYLGDVSLALPFSSVITEEQVEYISQQIKKLESWSGKVTATEAAKAVGAQAFIAPPPPLQNSSGGTIDTSQELDEILHSPSRNSWWNRLLTRHLQYIGDAVILAAALWFSYLLRFDFRIPEVFIQAALTQMPLFVLWQILALRWFGAYRLIWQYIGLADAKIFISAALTSTLPVLLLRLTLPERFQWWRMPFTVMVSDICFSFGGVLMLRLLTRFLHEHYGNYLLLGQNENSKKQRIDAVLMLGAGRASVLAAREIQNRSDLNLKVVGFVDEDPNKQQASIYGVKVLGGIAELPRFVREVEADYVFVISNPDSPQETQRIIDICEAIPIKVRIIPGYHDVVRGKVKAAHN